MICPNKTLPEWKALDSLNPELSLYYWNKFEGNPPNYLTDPKVLKDLFDSNPELANQVYEALGFNNVRIPKFIEESFGENDTRFANISLKHGVRLNSNQKITLDNFFNYITSSSEQKKLVTELLEKEYGITLEDLKELVKTDEDAKLFILMHEQAHIDNNDLYNENLRGLDKLDPKILQVEARANQNAYITLKNYKNFELTPQQKQQALQQYAEYLTTIFPDSKVKDIVYHGTDVRVSNFDKTLSGKKTGWGSTYKGIHFVANKEAAKTYTKSEKDNYGYLALWLYLKQYAKSGKTLTEQEFNSILNDVDTLVDVVEGSHYYGAIGIDEITYDEYKEKAKIFEEDVELDNISDQNLDQLSTKISSKYENPEANIISALVDIANPLIHNSKGRRYVQEVKDIYSRLDSKNDGILVQDTVDRLDDKIGFRDNIQVVFEPKQIHILGNQKDIEGFKQFVNSAPENNPLNIDFEDCNG